MPHVDERAHTLRIEIHRIDDELTWALHVRERIVALETKLDLACP